MLLFWSWAALVPLDHPGHYLHWGVINISVANVVVIALMASAFIAALVLPFPGRRRREEHR